MDPGTRPRWRRHNILWRLGQGDKPFTSIETSFSPAYENHQNYYTKGFTIRPSKSANDQELFADAKGIYDGGTVLWKGAVKYEMKIPKDPVQKYVRYDVLSASDEAVASIDVPVWVSGN